MNVVILSNLSWIWK